MADAPFRGFTLNAIAVPGRAAPKPDPAELRIAELERKLKKGEEAHQESLRKAAGEAGEAARAAEARGREEGRREGEKAALEKYDRTLEGLRKGIKGVRSHQPGDLFCHVVVETPVSLTTRQRELLKEFADISEKDVARHNPRSKSWYEKVKEFFES